MVAVFIFFVLPATSLFLPKSVAEVHAQPRAGELSPPLGYLDRKPYAPRVTFDIQGRIIENTGYGIPNPDLPHRFLSCWGKYWDELLHAGEDWYPMDSGNAEGAEVTAIADGVVLPIDVFDYPGRAIVIMHPQLSGPSGGKIHSVYMHLRAVDLVVKNGQNVRRGDRLGWVMRQDYQGKYPQYHSANDSHLHFEIREFPDARHIYKERPDCNRGDRAGRGYFDKNPDAIGYTEPSSFLVGGATGDIGGVVKIGGGVVTSAIVTFVHGRTIRTTTTDMRGAYVFSKVSAGGGTIGAYKEGFGAGSRVVAVAPNASIIAGDIFLVPLPAPTPTPR
jgi:murein DD-endopeptidase MepM/ murein hydrolase activator NlpD